MAPFWIVSSAVDMYRSTLGALFWAAASLAYPNHRYHVGSELFARDNAIFSIGNLVVPDLIVDPDPSLFPGGQNIILHSDVLDYGYLPWEGAFEKRVWNERLDRLVAGLAKIKAKHPVEWKVLAIMPTANDDKFEILKLAVPSSKQARAMYRVIKVDSGVGEQPDNYAGKEGSDNRIRNAVKSFLRGSFAVTKPKGEEWKKGDVLEKHDAFVVGHEDQKELDEDVKVGKVLEWCEEQMVGEILFPSIENFMAGIRTKIDGLMDTQPLGWDDETKPTETDKNREIAKIIEDHVQAGYRKALKAHEEEGKAEPVKPQKPEFKTALKKATDYGCASVFDPINKKLFRTFSQGVKAPQPLGHDMTRFAMAYGWETHHNEEEWDWMYGALTVGACYAQVVPSAEVQKQWGVRMDQNWHWAVANNQEGKKHKLYPNNPASVPEKLDRYDILRASMEKLNAALGDATHIKQAKGNEYISYG